MQEKLENNGRIWNNEISGAGSKQMRAVDGKQRNYLKWPKKPILVMETFNVIQIKLRHRRNNTKVILYGLSDLCAIRDEPHPLINMENYIPY